MNTLLLAAAEGPALRHVHLVEGTRWYGMHLGPYPTPAEEDDPRHLPPNFYYDQQDLLAARAAAGGWAWSASRPSLIVDVAPGRARNLASTLGAYAALCGELGAPLDFPGSEAAFRALNEVTDASLLARAIFWMLEAPAARNRAFNVTNGDVFRWQRLWPRVADAFAIPCGIPRPMRLAAWMADKDTAWARIAGLARPLSEVARWDFFDFVLGLEHDLFASTPACARPASPSASTRRRTCWRRSPSIAPCASCPEPPPGFTKPSQRRGILSPHAWARGW
jgi:nucleoside-diphosphate-sugar epimerase